MTNPGTNEVDTVRRNTLILSLMILASCYFPGQLRGLGDGGAFSIAKGTSCNGFAEVDPCASSGLACTPVLVDGGFECELPGPQYACETTPGCASGLSCVSDTCLQACASTAECADPLTICSGLGDAGSFCLLNPCGGYRSAGLWAACNAESDAGDGTCIVLGENNGNPQGVCQQGGTVAQGGACDFYRGDAGGAFCAPGLLCMVDAAEQNVGLCMPACDPFHPSLGPACQSGDSCVPTTIPLPPPAVSAADFYDETGVCAQSCRPGAGDPPGDPPDGGAADGGSDGGIADAGLDAGPPPPAHDAGTASAACSAPLSCQNGSITGTPNFVCLP